MQLYSDPATEHLLRRVGFGARPDELDLYRNYSIPGAIGKLLEYEDVLDDVDSKIGTPGYASTTARGGAGGFSPNTSILDARQRWLFRMVHTSRPLQEKMTLFWHNHFATAYGKLNGQVGAEDATRYLAAKPSEDRGGVRGQIEMLRDNALGNFRDMLVNIAQDTAMLYWLDGFQNVRAQPQENFGREIMELFTLGVTDSNGAPNYTEADVYAAARVFTGWNLTRGANGAQQFLYRANQHDPTAKTFTFPIYPDGSRTIPARAAAGGMQDGLDFIDGLARHPATGRHLATKLYRFFISETGPVSQNWVERIATTYQRRNFDMKEVMRSVLLSPEFSDPANYFARYSWPVEFVVRAVKDVGWAGYSVNDALTPLGNMGQNLFDPPDVNGWDQGATWFSTGSMLARMNYASALATNQRFNLANKAKPFAATPETLLAHVVESLRSVPLDKAVTSELSTYLRATGPWTGSTAQIQNKVTGLVHLVAGTPEYQFV